MRRVRVAAWDPSPVMWKTKPQDVGVVGAAARVFEAVINGERGRCLSKRLSAQQNAFRFGGPSHGSLAPR